MSWRAAAKRRLGMRPLAVGGCLLAAWLTACSPSTSPDGAETEAEPAAGATATGTSAEAPNIVFIIADDLGYGDLGVYGSEVIRTPNIDSLARDGVRFTSGYVAAAVCGPSRAGFITGRYPQRHGYEFNLSGRDYALSRDEATLGEVLRSAGYATGAIGKWQIGWQEGTHALDRGFDEFFGMRSGSLYIDPSLPGVESWAPEMSMIPEERRRPLFRGRERVEESDYLTEILTREAVDFIDRHHDERFFLYLAHYAPHAPLQATKKYLDRYRHIEDPARRIFAAMVSALDDGVGEVLEALRRHGIEDDTLVVFISDNGCAGYVEGACSNEPLRGGKRWFFEGGIRVPYMMRWPGVLPEGLVYDNPVSTLDLMPTFAAAAGAPLPQKPLDGVNLFPYIDGSASGLPHDRLFWRAGPNRAALIDGWKLWQVNRASAEEVAATPPFGGLIPDWEAPHGSPQGRIDHLHELRSDIGETENRAQQEAERLRSMAGELDAWESGLIEPMFWSDRGSTAMVDGEPVLIIF